MGLRGSSGDLVVEELPGDLRGEVVVHTQAETVTGTQPALLRVVMHLLRLLKSLQRQLGLMLTRYMPPHRVVTGEGARAERTRHPDTLVPLPDMRAQIRLVTIQTFAERTLEFLPWKNNIFLYLLFIRFLLSRIRR